MPRPCSIILRVAQRFAWQQKSFSQLTAATLYDSLALRQAVFVVEQACAYLDADGYDAVAHHIWAQQDHALVAYARVLPAGSKLPAVSIGRVIVAPAFRGQGVAHELMAQALVCADDLWGPGPRELDAQAHLTALYAAHGFVATGHPFVEDGIPHEHMRRA